MDNITLHLSQTPRQWRHSAYHHCHTQLDHRFKMDSAEWYVVWATRLLFMHCDVIATVHLSIRNIVSNKTERNFASIRMFNANTIHNCMPLKLRDVLKKIRSLSNEMTMCRICTSNVSCDSGEIVSDLHYIHYVAPLVGSLHLSTPISLNSPPGGATHHFTTDTTYIWCAYSAHHNNVTRGTQ